MTMDTSAPTTTSKASMTTSALRRPATIRNVLQYSLCHRDHVPAAVARGACDEVRHPNAIFASAASATSGCENSAGKMRPCRPAPEQHHRQHDEKDEPLRRPSQRWPAPGTAHAAAQTST